jgi:sec-independent protein translocase protein TatB
MPNFTLSEILTIALVILIVFGPQRLPEMAQKAGALIRKGRTMVNDLRREFEGELREVTQPLKEVSDELKGVGREAGASLNSLSDEVRRAKSEVESELADTGGAAGEESPSDRGRSPEGAAGEGHQAPDDEDAT